jgi:hypothetical protein
MESFHIIILLVASVSLIAVLTAMGVLLTIDKRSQKFPTSHSIAPDGWEPTTTSEGVLTISDADPTNNPNNPNNDKEKKFDGDDICKKKEWADSNKVYWDGITTYNGC